jgi:pimeloyl-ACP methyl ester carboxylesterase
MNDFVNIDISGLSIELWRRGSGQTLLFLHSGEGIEPALPLLQSLSDRFQVIAPSHPGFGNSDLPQHFTKIDDLTYFYLDLIRALDLDDIILVGSSFGAWIAAEIAITNASSLSAMVLLGALGAKFGDETTREIADLFSIPQYEQSKLIYSDERATDFSACPEDVLNRLARNHISFALFGWSPTLHNPKLRYRLHRIDLPTLILSGEHDRVVSPDYGRRFADAIPNATFKIINGAGHYPHVEAQKQTEKEIDEFIASHLGRRLEGIAR